MRIKVNVTLSAIVVCLFALTRPSLTWASTKASGPSNPVPVVRKIEPPNWWTNYTPELTLLLTGENLNTVRVESGVSSLTVLGLNTSANGHYLFLRLRIGSDLKPGIARLRLLSAGASTSIELPFLTRPDPGIRFKGISRDDVIYLIMPDRFSDGDPSNDKPGGSTGVYDRHNPMAYHGGDLHGIRDHLNYLYDLGITTLWLTPVWKNTDSDYHGYHVVDFYALDEHMGTMQEYQALVADAHKLGMKVLIDYVANHTGPQHPWANDPPTPAWFHGTPAHHLEPSYDFSGLVDPHASPREYRNTLDGWFAGKLPDLNPDHPPLALYLAQNAMWWVEMAQLDGFRLDTFPYSSRAFWSGWNNRISEVYPLINAVGEVADKDPTITSFFEGGRNQFDGIDSGLATVFDFPLEAVLRDVVVSDAPMQRIVNVLRQDELYPHPESLVTFIGNHDHKRFVSLEGSNLDKLKAAFSLLLTLRGIPQIYYGDEIGMSGGDDPDNRHDFPGGFPGDPHNAFTASERNADEQDVFSHVQSLLALRKKHSALRSGKQWHIAWGDTYYAFVRETAEEKLLVIYNNAYKMVDLEIPVDNTPLENAGGLQSILGNTAAQISAGNVRISLAGKSLAVFNVSPSN